jgi:hypothetical protein
MTLDTILSASVIMFIFLPFGFDFDYYFVDEVVILLLYIATFFAIYGHILSIIVYVMARIFKKKKLQKYSVISFCFSMLCLVAILLLLGIKRLL